MEINKIGKIRCWMTSLFICFNVLTSLAQVSVYPAPEGVKTSNRYEVAVQQNNLSQQSFVYLSSPLDNDEHNAEQVRPGVIKDINKNEMLKQFYFGGKTTDINAEQSVAWTCLSFSGEISVEIKSKKETIKNYKILPSSVEIEAKIEGNSLKFSISEPRKLAVVINGDCLNPLFLFADAPEVGVPDKKKLPELWL
jgi:hypothetical protein